MRTNRRRKRGYLFLFLVLAIAVVLFTIPIYLLMDNNKSTNLVNRLYHPEKKESSVEKKVEKKEALEKVEKFLDEAAEQATEVVKSLSSKSKEDINTKEEPKTETKEKSVFSYWWSVLIALWLFKGLFKRS